MFRFIDWPSLVIGFSILGLAFLGFIGKVLTEIARGEGRDGNP